MCFVCESSYEINITELKEENWFQKAKTMNILPVPIVCEAMIQLMKAYGNLTELTYR